MSMKPTVSEQPSFMPSYKPKLSLAQRDSGYRRLLAQLDCDDPFQSWLRDCKRLPEAAIKHFDFKSFSLETIVHDVPEYLPGYNLKAPHHLQSWKETHEEPQGGGLTPIKDFQGRILACQIVAESRCRVELAGEVWDGFRYKWWVSKSGQTQLPEAYENAQPMGFFCPPTPEDSQTLYLCEGFIKAAWTAWHHQVPVLGAVGADFKPIQLIETLALGGFKRAVLLPDAGMLHNDSIARQYYKLYEAMEAIGIPLYVGYWGQGEDKDIGDIDEWEVGNESPLRFPVF